MPLKFDMYGNFTIRVYGILLNEKKQILLSREFYGGKEYIKFPGGGLEYGEGTIGCLKREFIEELEIEVDIAELFHVSNKFFKSGFYPDTQVIAIYYRVLVPDSNAINDNYSSQKIPIGTDGPVSVFWADLADLENLLSLATDIQLIPILDQYFSGTSVQTASFTG